MHINEGVELDLKLTSNVSIISLIYTRTYFACTFLVLTKFYENSQSFCTP